MIHFRNVIKRYPPKEVALDGVDIRIAEGEFVFVAGASGAGKSTLLRLIYGKERASTGEVVVAGRNLATGDAAHIAALRRSIGIVFQDYRLLTRRSVLENVTLALELQGIPMAVRRRLGMEMLELIGLSERADALPPALSGGEQQRVAVARALIHRPKLLLADEPTGNLDVKMTKAIFDLLLAAHSAGVTVLAATHNLSIIEELNLRTIVLDKGKVLGDFARPSRVE